MKAIHCVHHGRHAAAFAWAMLAGAVVAHGAYAQTSAGAPAEQHPLGEHPAILVKRQPPSIDTNRLILMHPAQLMLVEAPMASDDGRAMADAKRPGAGVSAR